MAAAAATKKQRLTLTERFDYAVLKNVIESMMDPEAAYAEIEAMPPADREALLNMLTRYLHSASQDGTVVVTYRHSQGHPRGGRLFASHGLSLQGMKRLLRNTVSGHIYRDLDFSNCQPTLLAQFCDRNGIACPRLHEYVARRDDVMASLSDRSGIRDPKKAILVAMNGGKPAEAEKEDWLRSFHQEMEDVQRAIAPLAPNELRVARAQNPQNVMGSMINMVLCEAENKTLLALKEFLEERGMTVGVLIFDGCLVERRGLERGQSLEPGFLEEAAAYVQGKTGYRLKIVEKDMTKDRLPVPESIYGSHVPVPIRYVSCSAEAARYLVHDLRNEVKSCNAKIFVRIGNRWTCDPVRVDRFILSRCMFSNIHRLRRTPAGNVVHTPLTGEIAEAVRVVKGIVALLPDDETFRARLFDSSVGSLCFLDGVYDFRSRSFRTYEEAADVMTTIVIPRKFPARRPDPSVFEEVRQKIFLPIFGEDADFLGSYMAFKARGLAGCYTDKKWACLVGERNCGKGTLQELDKLAFGGYVNEINANSFLLKPFADGDAAKSLSWAADCEFTRLSYSNELSVNPDAPKSRSLTLDGNLIKRFQSGGDEIICRKNYQDESRIRVMTRLLMNLNEPPDVAPKDALETLTLFRFPHQFVSRAVMESPDLTCSYFRLEDPTIKVNLCRREDVLDAYTWMLLDAYQDDLPEMCPRVRADIREFQEDAGQHSALLRRRFRFTGNPRDFVTLRRLRELEGPLGMKRLKMKRWLMMIGGVEQSQCTLNGVPQGRAITMVIEIPDPDLEDPDL